MSRRARLRDALGYYMRFYFVYILGGAILCLVALLLVLENARQEPPADHSVALMAAGEIAPDALEALEAALAAAADDLNGDGDVRVRVEQFAYAAATQPPDASLAAAYAGAAQTIRFSAESIEGDCAVYVLRQETYEALCAADASFFLPLSECVEGVSGPTVPLEECASLGAEWEGYALAIRSPSADSFQDRQAGWEGGLRMIRALCGAK